MNLFFPVSCHVCALNVNGLMSTEGKTTQAEAEEQS